jgi:hypothetical protein
MLTKTKLYDILGVIPGCPLPTWDNLECTFEEKGNSRICRIYSVLKRRPMMTDFTVVLVGENLGY